MKKIIGILLLVIGLGIGLFVVYRNSKVSETTRTFSSYTLLRSSWVKYAYKFINQDGRVIDYSQSDVTTSEGQSYAMLRAVWIDDKEKFDLVWKWTRENLKRPEDKLFGWRWGKKGDGSYGFIENGGDNTASDSDTDIALALILASRRWGRSEYQEDAKKILDDIWKIETVVFREKRYLTAGNWADQPGEIVINPSYFAPYAWRIFGQVDKEHDWNSLIVPAYSLLSQVGFETLDQKKGVGLPPDWLAVDKKTGSFKRASAAHLSTDYSFDALRVPWRIALDYQWNKDEAAKDYLRNSFRLLEEEYKKNNKLARGYRYDGLALDTLENPTMYATSLGVFLVVNPDLAKKIYEEKIIKLYSNTKDSFDERLPYFEQNWLWFGAALINNFLTPIEG